MEQASATTSLPAATVSSVYSVVKLATYAMRTRFEFVLVGEDESHLRAVGEEAIAEIRYLHEKLSSFSPSSIVTRINDRAAHEAVDVDRETFELMALCREVWEQSEGAFDITIAPLMHEYGFREDVHRTDVEGTERRSRSQWKRTSIPQRPFPSPVQGKGEGPASDFAASRPNMRDIELVSAVRTIHFTRPGMAIDLGAVAKGYALDRAAAICRENGITCGLLHGGTSTVVAIGSPPDDERGWAVRIHDETEPLTVYLRDETIAVSAPRGRTVTKDRATCGHIIDPRIGRPAFGITTAAVIGPNAAHADAWSTALLVLQSRPANLSLQFITLIRSANGGWTCSPLTCRHAVHPQTRTSDN
jgi:FAD:protein FMN transferase